MKNNEAFVIANHATEDVSETTHTTEDTQAGLNVDDFIKTIGEFGRAQKLITLLLSLMIIPTAYQRTIMVFIGDEPPWTCVSDNSTTLSCINNGTFSESNTFYQDRCSMSRLPWNFTKPQTYSVLTQVSLKFYFPFMRHTLILFNIFNLLFLVGFSMRKQQPFVFGQLNLFRWMVCWMYNIWMDI